MRILFFGDSITQGFWDTDGGWVARIRKCYDKISVKDLDNNLQPEVFNLGISGNTTRDLKTRIKSETIVRTYKSSLPVIVIAIGSNDCLIEDGKQWVSIEEYRSNLLKIVDCVKPHAQSIVFERIL